MKKFLRFVYTYRIEKVILKNTPFILIWVKGNNKKILRVELQGNKEHYAVFGEGQNYDEYSCLQLALVWIDAQVD